MDDFNLGEQMILEYVKSFLAFINQFNTIILVAIFLYFHFEIKEIKADIKEFKEELHQMKIRDAELESQIEIHVIKEHK